MRLWLSKNSEVPLREQLVRQIMLGIISDDLAPGQRLPSTRELARRFRIHPNTVSAAYRDLERRGWLDFRKGSGVYVRSERDELKGEGGAASLDSLITAFLSLARAQGFSLADIRDTLRRKLDEEPPERFLIVEPDERLREILMAEVQEATGFPVLGASFDDCRDGESLTGVAVVALYGHADALRRALPSGVAPMLLHTRSIPDSLSGEKPPPDDALISIVSRWPAFLEWARVFLLAAGLDADSLDFRDARSEDWRRGLHRSALVITDALTVRELPRGATARVYRVIADSSLEELRGFVNRFLKGARA